ncbi:MAG: hypothetical protein HQ565_03125 [Bacteroidetes bacterium]|nr:hypothetical protein [Bacteroidota bacterium]
MIEKDHKQIFIGIDDTDNEESRGTGFHSRELAHLLENSGHAIVDGITRHQLFVHSLIRYTSQNSSACIGLLTDDIPLITEICEQYLMKNSAPGSDAGLCISTVTKVTEPIIIWGHSAKDTILDMKGAIRMAKDKDIYLRGFTGNHEGIIGALAAVGLRADGNDGRFIWRKGRKELRELSPGIISAEKLIEELELEAIASRNGQQPEPSDRIYINEWVRPILKNHKAVLIADKTNNTHEYEWKLTSKEIIRSIS